MEFGLFSLSSRGTLARDAWDEDVWEFQLAEELGFTEAWVAEHPGGLRPDALPVADLLICRAAALTKTMRFGPAIRPLPYYNPVQVATAAATCDHLTNGRYMAGFGGSRGGDAGNGHFRQFGINPDGVDKRAMMFEALDLVLQCWERTEPFDFHGTYYHGERIKVLPKPLQQPRMPVGIANSTSTITARLIGEKGLFPLHFYYDTAQQLAELSSSYLEGAAAAGRTVRKADIRVVRFVHVADTDKQARDEVRDATDETILKMKEGMPLQHVIRALPPGGTVDDITFDYLVDSGIFFVGSPDTVHRQIMDFYEQMGGFGFLIFAVGNASLGSREQRRRSWELFIDEVAPRLARLDPDRDVPLSASGGGQAPALPDTTTVRASTPPRGADTTPVRASAAS